MPDRVLVTGGAGFVGSHLVDALLQRGDRVRVLDDLLGQAHPGGVARFLARQAELQIGDLRDRAAVDQALGGVDVVYHLGGMVGNGQSMVQIRRYLDVNAVGTATLLEAMVARARQFRRLVVASSMAAYGDGAYRCVQHGIVSGVRRTEARLRAGRWEPLCPICEEEVEGIPTTEDQPLRPVSVYGISKRDQEETSLVVGAAYGIPTIALRYLNTYGSRQALSNPYTGVAAVFATRILHGRRPLVFEDGRQKRDLVHVSDVVRATIAAADAGDAAIGRPYNVATGRFVTVAELARLVARKLGRDLEPEIPGTFRRGDIRHCFADTSRAREQLGWEPRITLDEGATELAAWAAGERPEDGTDAANTELRELGILT
ncbi:MAG: NAD-dependent epimerase/dehydratase family protein [Myxococcota bacterium]